MVLSSKVADPLSDRARGDLRLAAIAAATIVAVVPV